jgi:ATP-dependent helicase HrpB
MTALPIAPLLPDIAALLGEAGRAVLEAPPGAGKSTAVPPALLLAPWLGRGRVVMLEPRRLAARAVARYMAGQLGEKTGQTVGFATRFEREVGPDTRIEIITEGILTNRLQRDPELAGVGCLVFDEFHERSLEGDLGLALALESRAALRPDLRILVMSATLESDRVAALMGGAPVLRAEGRMFPVEIVWGAPPRGGEDRRIEGECAATIRRALEESEGSILVFLPGMAEIRRVAGMLGDLPRDVLVAPLHGSLPVSEQDVALRPAPPGQRKIVLATNIAETSLTIEGISVVVDSGLARRPRFDPGSGLTRLETVAVSRASAEQRAGRAGRLGPGRCYRLWPREQHGARPAHDAPEILEADLAPLALDLAAWGARDAGGMGFLDPPPPSALAAARELLHELGALDGEGGITAEGRAMAALPLHPRLAHMALKAKALGLGALACRIAALVSERDLLPPGSPSDLRLRLEALERPDPAGRRVLAAARQISRALGLSDAPPGAGDVAGETGLLLGFAWPERLALPRSGGGGRFLLAGGKGAVLPGHDKLAGAEALGIAEMEGGVAEGRIRLAAPLEKADFRRHFADRIERRDEISFDEAAGRLRARRVEALGSLILAEQPLADPPPDAMADALCRAIRQAGAHVLPWDKESRNLAARIELLRRFDTRPGNWPDCSETGLMAGLEEWLSPFLTGITGFSGLGRLDMNTMLSARLDHAQRHALSREAPERLEVPSGSSIRIDYAAGEVPVLAVKLQEMFGTPETPRLAGGRLPLMLHLLSPAGRPAAVTDDLARFWKIGYPSVRAELRGRYPRHAWPEDPTEAVPHRGTKKRAERDG